MARPLLCVAGIALGAALAWPGVAAAQPAGKKYALLVGVNKYQMAQVPELKYATRDLEQLGKLFAEQGYDVRTVPDDSAYRHRILSELINMSLRATEADTFVLYYAGHGVRNVEVNHKTYWLTYAAQLNLLDVEGIRIEHLLDYVRDIPAGRKLILLDHCFSGDVVELVQGHSAALTPSTQPPAPPVAGAPAAPPDGPAASPGAPAASPGAPAAPPGAPAAPRDAASGSGRLERVAFPVDEFKEQVSRRPKGTTVMTAARGSAFELDKLQHGVFTAALLEACRSRGGDTDGNAKLSVFELAAYLDRRVPALLLENNAPSQKVDTVPPDDVLAMAWDVCSLPVEGRAEVNSRTTEYETRLREWEQKGWLTMRALFRILNVLIAWKDAEGDVSRLTEDQRRSLTRIREALDQTAPDLPERPRAEGLRVIFDTGGQ